MDLPMELDDVQKRYRKWIKMTKYERCLKELELNGTCQMKAHGNSMTPILKSGSKLTFKKLDTYKKGDIVFCKVKGRYIDAHKITRVCAKKGYMISNNHGLDNGWTKAVYGKVVTAEYNNNQKHFK